MSIAPYLPRLYDLRRGRDGTREKPHKPVVLLTMLDGIQVRAITENRIVCDENFQAWWKEYFEIVREGNDQPNLYLPLYYLKNDQFWNIHSNNGTENDLSAFGGMGDVQRLVDHFSLERELWDTLEAMSPKDLDLLRVALITRYFGDHLAELLALSDDHCGLLYRQKEAKRDLVAETKTHPYRSSEFTRIVVKAYEHECAACGLRILTQDHVTLVDAAHLVPFAESHDDHPSNGMALCKNHHWAMDRKLIAPGPDHFWHASPVLDERQAGQKTLLNLDGKPILLPKEAAFYPKQASLVYRMDQLAG